MLQFGRCGPQTVNYYYISVPREGGGISPYLYRNDNIIPNDNDTIIIIVLKIMETVKRVVAVAGGASTGRRLLLRQSRR